MGACRKDCAQLIADSCRQSCISCLRRRFEMRRARPAAKARCLGASAQVRVHASSVNAGLSAALPRRRRSHAPQVCALMIFEEVTRTESQLGVRQCTAVNAHVRRQPSPRIEYPKVFGRGCVHQACASAP